MSDEIPGWEIVSERVNKAPFWETAMAFLMGSRPVSTITYVVRETATGTSRTVTCLGPGQLREKVAQRRFDPIP